jgi:hypothetical protein
MVVEMAVEKNAPIKNKITLWLALNNKLLTLDVGIKRGWIGPNMCSLCKNQEEFVSHLFISCVYAEKVMKIV